MCIVLSGQEGVVEQARRQLEDLVSHEPAHYSTSLTFVKVPVWAVLDYTETRTISRELLLVKVSILGPEYLDDQLLGGPSHDLQPAQQIPLEVEGHHHESKLLDREIVLAQSFERSGKSDKPATATSPAPPPPTQVNSTPPTNHNNHNSTNEPAPLTPSQLLQLKHGNLAAINTLSAQFGAKIVDVSENRVIVELSAKSHRVEAFLSLLRPFGILESARTGACKCYHQCGPFLMRYPAGVMVMPRTPISAFDEEEATDEAGPVDASLLPPG
jgi:acetolactate synthase-1/3 small subunit